MMKRCFLLLMCLAVLMLGSMETMAKKVWMLGDSTMTEYDESEPTGGRGWGMYFGNFLVNGWTSVNMAKGGRDSRGGYNELWQNCKNDVMPGDYVIIQFAHNDAACGGADYEELVKYYTDKGDTEGLAATKAIGRGTIPSTTYKEMLKKICDEVRAKGATPILASAVCRHQFTDGKVRRAAKHDIGGSYDAIVNGELKKGLSVPEGDHTYDYPYQMKQVADAEGVAFLDMTSATASLMESYEAQGSGNCFNVMFDKKIEANDGTHYNVTGALLAARLCAQLILQEQSNYTQLATLAANVNVPTDMSFNPATANMGEVYVGQAATKEISLSALGLSPAEGTVTISATNGILLSYDKQNWDTSLTTDYTMGTLIKTFYVKVAITATGEVKGTVTATLGEKSVELPVSVTGVELGGGDPFTATWPLTADAQPTTTEGVSVIAANGLLAGLQANGYDAANGWQFAETSAGAWNAARIDNIEGEYVEFSITAPTGRTIDITNIAMQLKEVGGDNLHFHIKSSTDNFATETSLFGFQSAADTWTDYNKSVNVKLEEGQTLKVRVYPWSEAITTGNWLCVKDVVITGQSKDANGVNISGSITYALDKGGLTQGDDVVMSPETLAAGFAYKSWSAGSALIVKGTATYQGADGEDNIVQTAIVNNTGAQWPNTGGKDYTLTLTLTPDYGFSFVPTKVSFQAARYGTGSGRISASIAAGEQSEVLFNDADVNRSSQSLTIASFSQTVNTSITATADQSLKLNFWFPGLNGDNRTMGISNVVIEGTLVGAPEQVVKYLLNTSVVPAEGGTITRTPALDMYKEGAQVKLTANPAEGYQFTEWQDGNGTQVAITPETTVTMDAQKTMKAVFELLPMESLAIPTPDGEYIDWKEATLENCNVENNGANVGSTRSNTTATFYISNSKQQNYTLSFATGAKGLEAKLNVLVSNGANEYLNQTVDIENTGAWDLTQEHSLDINQLPVGDYMLKFTVVSTTGSYAGNWGKLAIRKNENVVVDPTAPIITKVDGSDFVTSEGTPGGTSAPRWETDNNNWGYIKDGSTLTYTVKAQQTARVKVSIEDTKYASDGTATFSFKQGETTVAEAVVNGTQDNYGTDSAETGDKLTEGETYTLVVTFNGSGGSWIMNCRNFQFEAISDVEPVYALTTACSPVEGGTVKPNGGSYKAGAEVKLTATANPYYTFQKWEDETTEATRTLMMPAEATTATAYFTASPLTIPTTDTNPFRIEWAECSNGSWNGTNLDSFRSGGTATYTITNTEDCAYILKYQAASNNDGVQLKMQIKQGSNVIWEETKDVENTGNWQTYKDYEMNTTALTQGEYTLVVNFISGGGYTANVRGIQFKADKPIVAGQMLTLSVDGIAMGESVLNPLVAEGHSATIAKSLTALPNIVATFDGVDAEVSMSNVEPTVDGNTLTYVKNVSGTDYTIIFTNYHPYTAGESDKTHAVTPGVGTSENNVWTDGTITMTFGGDWGFKMNNGEKTISIPTDWQVKQIVFAGTGDNYNDLTGTIDAMTSEGANVYMPFNTTLKKSTDQDFTFNFDNHVAGTPVRFTVSGCGQMYIRTVKIVYQEVAVATAPTVVSSTISDTEHKNHVVVTVNYDHAVAAAKATFGDKPARVKGLGTSTVKYSVWDLDYNKDYTFTIAAGDLEDAYGNKTTEAFTKTFTVGSQLDNTITEADFDYTVSTMAELKAALDAVNDANKSKTAERKYIYLKNGTYESAEQLRANYNVSLIGESRDGVTIIYTPAAEGMGERTITLGYGAYAQDITFRTGIPVGGGRGVALYTEGEHVILNNCAALGGQDTYLTGGTCYWKGGIVEGAVDFIFGGGDYLFDGTTLSVYSGGKVTAGAHSANTEWGYVFKNCTLVAADASTTDGSFSLGRPWQGEPRVAYINTDMQVLPVTNGWDNMGKMPTHYYEYNSTHNGQAVDLSKRLCGDSQNQTTAGTDYTLTAEQAAEYTMENIFGEVDGWYPAEEIPNVVKPGSGSATGIETLRNRTLDVDAAYNIAGQRVSRTYKGMVIINGKKMVMK